MIADDLVGAPRRIRGETPGARRDNDHVHQGLVVCTRSPAPQEGKPRQRFTTVIYTPEGDSFPDTLDAGPDRRAADHRGLVDDGEALPKWTRVNFTMCDKTRSFWDRQTGEWVTKTETIITRLWPAQPV